MENGSPSADQELDEQISQVRILDINRMCEILGIQKRSQAYLFEFFNRQILFDRHDFTDLSNEAITPSIKKVLCHYMKHCPKALFEASDRLVTFREFPDSGPLFSRFAENTNKIIQQTFSGKLDRLKARCVEIGGMIIKAPSYDLSVQFKALPRIPVVFNFNDTDEMLPSTAVFHFYDDAIIYLDIKSLGILSTTLTGLLIQPPQDH